MGMASDLYDTLLHMNRYIQDCDYSGLYTQKEVWRQMHCHVHNQTLITPGHVYHLRASETWATYALCCPWMPQTWCARATAGRQLPQLLCSQCCFLNITLTHKGKWWFLLQQEKTKYQITAVIMQDTPGTARIGRMSPSLTLELMTYISICNIGIKAAIIIIFMLKIFQMIMYNVKWRNHNEKPAYFGFYKMIIFQLLDYHVVLLPQPDISGFVHLYFSKLFCIHVQKSYMKKP